MSVDRVRSPRRRALWISSDFWEKPATGGAHYTRSVLSALQASSSVEIVGTYVAEWPPLSSWRKAAGLAKSFVRGNSVFRHVSTDPALPEALRHGLLENLDTVVVNGSDQIRSISDIPDSVAVIYVMHNLDADYIAASIDGLPSWQKSLLTLSGEIAKCAQEESAILRRAAIVIGISLEELDAVKAKNPDAVTVWFPPTFEAPAKKRPGPKSDSIVVGMLGATDHYPNLAAVEFFLREAWPHADPRTRLVIAGKGTEVFADPARNIAGLGAIPSMDAFWEEIDVLAVPIQQGAGTNVKVCEALANRVPLLATQLALRGLPLIDDPAVCIARTPGDWRAALQWDKLLPLARSQPAAELAELFTQAATAKGLNNALQGLARKPADCATPV